MNCKQIFLTVILFTAIYQNVTAQAAEKKKLKQIAKANVKASKKVTQITMQFADKLLAHINILRLNPKIVGGLLKKKFVNKPSKGQPAALTQQALARSNKLKKSKPLPAFTPSEKLFDIAKSMVAGVKKAGNLKIKKSFEAITTKNKLVEAQADCFYFYPSQTKTASDLVLRSMVSNTNGSKKYDYAVQSSFGKLTPIFLNEPGKVAPKKLTSKAIKPKVLIIKKHGSNSKRPVVRKGPKASKKPTKPVKPKSKKSKSSGKKKGSKKTASKPPVGPKKQINLVYKKTLIGASFDKDHNDPNRNIGCIIISTNAQPGFQDSPYKNKALKKAIDTYFNKTKTDMNNKVLNRKILPPSKSVEKIPGVKITRIAPKKLKSKSSKKSKAKPKKKDVKQSPDAEKMKQDQEKAKKQKGSRKTNEDLKKKMATIIKNQTFALHKVNARIQFLRKVWKTFTENNHKLEKQSNKLHGMSKKDYKLILKLRKERNHNNVLRKRINIQLSQSQDNRKSIMAAIKAAKSGKAAQNRNFIIQVYKQLDAIEATKALDILYQYRKQVK